MTTQSLLIEAQQLDSEDVLREMRQQFSLPRDAAGQPLIYLCGHSLGLAPLTARAAVLRELKNWETLGVQGHLQGKQPWLHYHELFSEALAQLTGAKPLEVVAMNSLTINLHLLLSSFFQPQGQRRKILIEYGAFPADRHAVMAHLHWHGLDQQDLIELAPLTDADCVTEEQIEQLLQQQGDEIALILWPGVQFKTGQFFDVTRIVRAGHAAGCRVGFDLAHAIGNVPLKLHADNVDFAVWCSYKYLNSGPGALAGCFVHERHHDFSGPRLAGWWGHELSSRFDTNQNFRALPGAAGWQVSNPPIFSTAPLLSSLSLFSAATTARLRNKSSALTGYLWRLLQDYRDTVHIITPAEISARGCQLSLRILGQPERGERVLNSLQQRGVVCDWRTPNVIRVAPVPLYNRFEDVWHFAAALRDSL
jgi:kynureninase